MECEKQVADAQKAKESSSVAQNNLGKELFMSAGLKFLNFISDVGVATNEDVRRLCFSGSGHGDKSARRLTIDLEKEGLLVSLENNSGSVGRSSKVFAINKEKKGEVMDITGKENIRIIDLKSSFHARHQLCLNSVLTSFISCCDKSEVYGFDFITDFEGSKNNNDAYKILSEKEYLPYFGKVVFVPDAVACISNDKERKKALLFIEMDRETTTMKKIGGKSKNVETKIKAYDSLWKSQKFKRYDEMFDYKFSGFRLLWVTLTKRRLDGVSRFCCQEGLGDSAWLTTLIEIESKGVFGKVWIVSGSDKARSFVKEKL